MKQRQIWIDMSLFVAACRWCGESGVASVFSEKRVGKGKGIWKKMTHAIQCLFSVNSKRLFIWKAVLAQVCKKEWHMIYSACFHSTKKERSYEKQSWRIYLKQRLYEKLSYEWTLACEQKSLLRTQAKSPCRARWCWSRQGMLKQTKTRCKTQQEPMMNSQSIVKWQSYLSQVFSIFLNLSQLFSIMSTSGSIFLNFSQFFSIFLDFSRLCRNMHGIHFCSIGSRVSFSQFFSIFLDYVEICMEYIFVVLGAGSVFLNFSQLFSIE